MTEHERIVDAIEARDPAAAVRALEKHRERSDYSGLAEKRRPPVDASR